MGRSNLSSARMRRSTSCSKSLAIGHGFDPVSVSSSPCGPQGSGFGLDLLRLDLPVSPIRAALPLKFPDAAGPGGFRQFEFDGGRILLSWSYSRGLLNILLLDGSTVADHRMRAPQGPRINHDRRKRESPRCRNGDLYRNGLFPRRSTGIGIPSRTDGRPLGSLVVSNAVVKSILCSGNHTKGYLL
jgi:ribosomal protein S30